MKKYFLWILTGCISTLAVLYFLGIFSSAFQKWDTREVDPLITNLYQAVNFWSQVEEFSGELGEELPMIQLQPIYRVGSGNDQYFIALSNGGFNNGPSEVFISSNREFRWRPWISIKDTGVDTCHGGNRPMALTTQDGKLLLTVLDKCGGGAMEGYDSVLELQSDGKREMVKCYNYDNWGQFEQEEEEGGWSWYARGTTQFDRLEEAPLSECKPNVKIIYQ